MTHRLCDRAQVHSVPVTILQRFIFHLSWTPEECAENEAIDTLLESGALEMF